MRCIILCLLLAIPTGAWGQTNTSEQKATESSPWEISTLQYRVASGIEGMRKNANPTWNPLVIHSLALQPGWQLTDSIALQSQFEMAQELTQSDWNNDGWFWSDLTLNLTFENLVAFESPGIAFDLALGLRLPTSKRSQAETLILEPSATFSAKKQSLKNSFFTCFPSYLIN